jgi:energy-coupling factor transport system permease protein
MAHAISLSLAIYGFDTKRKRTTWRNVGLLVESRLTTVPVKNEPTKPL